MWKYMSFNFSTGTPAPGELPPPYTPLVSSMHINCKVCQNPISLEGRQNLHVIKCQICNEATVSSNLSLTCQQQPQMWTHKLP